MKTILVTGGGGYVGSHCCKQFRAHGWAPVVVDDFARGWRDFARYGESVEGSILDRNVLRAAFERFRPDAVAHFAALAYVGESVSDPATYYRNNVEGALNILDAMREFGVGDLIFSSTCATYGIPDATPIDERAPQRPINPYGRSKLMTEHMIRDYASAYGMRYGILRYFNAAGADPDGEIGERHDPEPHAIPRAILAALGRLERFDVLGSDYDTPDGTAIRDYIHVADLAVAHRRMLERLFEGGESLCCNLGTGTGTSVLEIVRAVEAASGRSIPLNWGPRRAGDPPALVADAALAAAELGWRPQVSDIETIVRTALRWHARES